MVQADESAGYDLRAPEAGSVDPLQRKLFKLGFKTQFTPGYVGLCLTKSSIGNKGVTHYAGVIDQTYPGEWGIILYNSSHERFEFKAGDKIAQCVFVQYGSKVVEWVSEEEFQELIKDIKRTGGFGSTGR